MASTPERLSGERPPRRSRAAKVKSRRPMSSRSVARRIGPAICISKRATRHAAPLRSGRETAEPNRRRKSAMRSRVRQRWWLAAGIAFSAAACERRSMLEPRPDVGAILGVPPWATRPRRVSGRVPVRDGASHDPGAQRWTRGEPWSGAARAPGESNTVNEGRPASGGRRATRSVGRGGSARRGTMAGMPIAPVACGGGPSPPPPRRRPRSPLLRGWYRPRPVADGRRSCNTSMRSTRSRARPATP
jgi:hypothetical protein